MRHWRQTNGQTDRQTNRVTSSSLKGPFKSQRLVYHDRVIHTVGVAHTGTLHELYCHYYNYSHHDSGFTQSRHTDMRILMTAWDHVQQQTASLGQGWNCRGWWLNPPPVHIYKRLFLSENRF